MATTQKHEKSVAEQIKQRIVEFTLLEQKKNKHLASKQKGKPKSIDEWSIHIPSHMNVEKTPLTPTPIDDSDQELPFNQQLDSFVHSILSENYQKNAMRKLFNRAQKQPLKNLWNSQYTNKLSFAVRLLTISSQNLAKQNKTKPLSKANKKTDPKQQNQNQNQSNIDSDRSDNQNEPKNKKKRKLKKNNKRVQFSPPSHKKDHSFSDNQEKHSPTSKNHKKAKPNEDMVDENSLLNKQTKAMIDQINAEIDRVQELYLIQMEQYHTLPYAQVDVMIQKSFKSTKIPNKNQNGKVQTQHIYPFQQGIPNFNPNTSNNLYPLSNMHNQRQENQNNMHDMSFSSHYFPFNPINSQINPLGMPFMPLNTSLTQLTPPMGQYGQMNHQAYGNGGFQNNQFCNQNFMMMNINNSFGQNTQNSHYQSATKSQPSGNKSSAKEVIMLENIDQDE